MLPFARVYFFKVIDYSKFVALDFPMRCWIDRVTLLNPAGGATITLYNRAFTGDAVNVQGIGASDTKCRLRFTKPIPLTVGDVVTVSGNSVSGYNVDHRVFSIDAINNTVVTDIDYTTDGRGGSAVLNIPSADQPMYSVFTATTVSGVSDTSLSLPVLFNNLDPVNNINSGFVRKIYAKVSANATYKMIIYGHTGHTL